MEYDVSTAGKMVGMVDAGICANMRSVLIKYITMHNRWCARIMSYSMQQEAPSAKQFRWSSPIL